jgi:hypothetical protein
MSKKRQGQDNEYYRRAVEPVVYLAATHYGVSPEQVYSAGRLKTASSARQLSMYLARITLGFSYPEVGRAFGRDHTTVMNACKKVTWQRTKDERYNVLIETMQHKLMLEGVEIPQLTLGISFPPKVWEKLRKIRDSGMLGDDMRRIVVQLVSMKLYEMGS